MTTADCIRMYPNRFSKSLTVEVYIDKVWADSPNGIPRQSYVLGSLEGEDAFPDVLPGMFRFSDNGKNPYSMTDGVMQ